MSRFLTISRRELVDLASPWDPQRVIDDYLDDLDMRNSAAPTRADVRELAAGGTLRFDLEHRRLGSVEAELHLLLLSPQELEAELAAALALKWWLWPLAMPFRRRIRRLLNRRIDEMLDELRGPRSTEDDGEVAGSEAPSSPTSGVRTTLRILTLDGRQIFEHGEGSI